MLFSSIWEDDGFFNIGNMF